MTEILTNIANALSAFGIWIVDGGWLYIIGAIASIGIIYVITYIIAIFK